MTDPTSNCPLWRVMQMAYPPPDKIQEPSVENLSRQIAAAEIRAIAKWISERHPIDPATGAGVGAMTVVSDLVAEADRAEAGE
jgi:hypothetical protein